MPSLTGGEALVRMLQLHGLEYVYRTAPALAYMEEFRVPLPSGTSVYYATAASETFPVGEWHRIELDFDLRAAPRAIVRHDGNVVVDMPLNGTITGIDTRVSVGIIYIAGPATAWTVSEDNVLVDVQ